MLFVGKAKAKRYIYGISKEKLLTQYNEDQPSWKQKAIAGIGVAASLFVVGYFAYKQYTKSKPEPNMLKNSTPTTQR